MPQVGKAPPISVAVTRSQRDEFEAEARRRGLGVSTTIRVLAMERAGELRHTRQLERAMKWQTAEALKLMRRVDAGELGEASQADIDRIFED